MPMKKKPPKRQKLLTFWRIIIVFGFLHRHLYDMLAGRIGDNSTIDSLAVEGD